MVNKILSPVAKEGSTFIVVATITDEDGAALVPSSMSWTLSDRAGTVINSRENVAIGAPASENDIVLQGDDLALLDSSSQRERRILSIKGTYNSAYGSGLPFQDEVHFSVDGLIQ